MHVLALLSTMSWVSLHLSQSARAGVPHPAPTHAHTPIRDCLPECSGTGQKWRCACTCALACMHIHPPLPLRLPLPRTWQRLARAPPPAAAPARHSGPTALPRVPRPPQLPPRWLRPAAQPLRQTRPGCAQRHHCRQLPQQLQPQAAGRLTAEQHALPARAAHPLRPTGLPPAWASKVSTHTHAWHACMRMDTVAHRAAGQAWAAPCAEHLPWLHEWGMPCRRQCEQPTEAAPRGKEKENRKRKAIYIRRNSPIINE